MNKALVFNTELNYIADDKIRDSALYLLELLPDYFYTMQASFSSFPHPDFALGEGGLVRHTKAAVRIAVELFRDNIFNTFEFKEHSQDLIIMALLLHDGFKQGLSASGQAVFEHSLLASQFILEHISELPMLEVDALYVSKMVAAHMGPWNVNQTGKIILPIPSSDEEKFVHACDYLASRGFINMKFIGNEIVPSFDVKLIRTRKK